MKSGHFEFINGTVLPITEEQAKTLLEGHVYNTAEATRALRERPLAALQGKDGCLVRFVPIPKRDDPFSASTNGTQEDER